MKCLHCQIAFHEVWNTQDLGADGRGSWRVVSALCPSCKSYNIKLVVAYQNGRVIENREFFAYPKSASRSPLPADVPGKHAADYKEACAVLGDSAKASAAISRRCLQHLLQECAGVQKVNLSQEIDQILASRGLPSHLADAVDAIRVIGNFAAHPIKSTNTGEIVEVDPGEAEWLLDVLEGLFDFYFVQPAILDKKREALNKKLQEAGKPLLK